MAKQQVPDYKVVEGNDVPFRKSQQFKDYMKEYNKKYNAKPRNKLRRRLYDARPDQLERRRKYNKKYLSNPEVRERHRAKMREYQRAKRKVVRDD